jgi:hypothetical protein
MEENSQLEVSAAWLQGKKPSIAIGYEAEWAPDSVYTRWRRENLSLPGIEPQFLGPLAHSPVAILTELSGLPI